MNTNSVQFFKTEESKPIPEDSDIIVAAWNLANPENIGKIIRLAHNLGASKALFIKDKEAHRESKIKKTAGFSFDQMAWEFISEEEFRQTLNSGYELAVLETCDGSTNIFTTKLPKRIVLLAGSESHGIPENIIDLSTCKVYIPMPGGCKSLNISNALSVAAFEWYRQQTAE
ncbi:TrmH family RNA methyltransferase [uncultured Draconibacterium sp.]|uniref:TrmH family RNA methyltransferase n=1 Tax=uncultured Draconibacterium sp. TaxID=1573823 RepID=UPI003217A137